jgi:heat shock protein HslJ
MGKKRAYYYERGDEMRTIRIITTLFVFAMLLSACAGSNTNDLAGTVWELTAFDESSPIEGTVLTIEFEEDQVSGNTGCNLFSGSYEVDGDAISFGALAWTERGCMDPAGVMEQERRYMELLGAVKSFELEGGELRLFTDSQGSLTFEEQGDTPITASQPSPIPPKPTVEAQPTEEPVFEPPAGFLIYRAESIGVSVYIPESWVEHTVVEGEYVILQSYPKDKYVGGEGLEPGDTKCDLSLRPEGESRTTLIDQWKSNEMTTILSEEEIVLGSGEPAIRVELDSLGRSNVVITEIGGRVVTLGCFGDFSQFGEIAGTIRSIE